MEITKLSLTPKVPYSESRVTLKTQAWYFRVVCITHYIGETGGRESVVYFSLTHKLPYIILNKLYGAKSPLIVIGCGLPHD